MTTLSFDVLDDQRKAFFGKLKAFGKTATLGGGTALALQIHHRLSFDFDLFIPTPLPRSLYRTIQTVIGEAPEKLVDTSDQLTVKFASGVELTFLYYWYPPLYPTIPTGSLPLFDRRDIATDKALTLGRRNVWRDYVDFFFLLKDGDLTLDHLITDAQKRFGNEFSPKLFLEQLSYTGDVADFAVTFVGHSYSPEEITAYLTEHVARYAQGQVRVGT